MLKVILKANEETRILNGHPWIFSNEIQGFEGNIVSGTVCDIYTASQQWVGRGFLNTSSKIMVRILTLEKEEINKQFFYQRIMVAWNYRQQVGLTNSCRVVFAEADFLPGLIIDKYGDYLVVQFLSLGMDNNKQLLVELLIDIFKPKGIYERSDVGVRIKEGLPSTKGVLYGTFDPQIQIEENGVLLQIDLENGQKTGYFLDQKMNRKMLATYVKNKTVLDCFSHTGGFGLHACLYGAREVVCVDISDKACSDIEKNRILNRFDQMHTVCADVFEYLRDDRNAQYFDVIILDPPAFTKAKDTVKSAYKGYQKINCQAIKMIKPGGILMTFSCSQHMTPTLFLEMLQESAQKAKRKVQMIDFRMQSLDHPTLLASESTFYLKCVVLHIL